MVGVDRRKIAAGSTTFGDSMVLKIRRTPFKKRTTEKKPIGPPSSEGSQEDAPSSKRVGFLPKVLDRTVIAVPLLDQFKKDATGQRLFHVAIDLNLDYKEGIEGARQVVLKKIEQILRTSKGGGAKQEILRERGDDMQYVFATLKADVIKELVRRDGEGAPTKSDRAIHHIWPDFDLKPLINLSISTVKGDAAHNAFAALGADIVWAVIDSGIDATHPHFRKHANLDLALPLKHHDFTSTGGDPRKDAFGHGTHVAGIIAGQLEQADATILATTRYRDENGEPTEVTRVLERMSGMAPRCKLLSLKVMDDDGRGNGTGRSSSIMAALQYIQRLNGNGKRLLVHGVNLSVGYDFDPEWFACGQSPLCVEVDRLVRSGVVVVVAAGNSGYGFVQSEQMGVVSAGLDLTINDPGNSDFAITVGSTHREMPHTYGVSYFSSKGPTGDGRMKPDLLAPGEKILSCASSQMSGKVPRPVAKGTTKKPIAYYREDSGTSMAAPHVSGVIAAFLSIRREFLKRPEEVKRIFLSTATDLNRAPYFQGRGLIDAMRAIQSV
jgi:serine protease AprX